MYKQNEFHTFVFLLKFDVQLVQLELFFFTTTIEVLAQLITAQFEKKLTLKISQNSPFVCVYGQKPPLLTLN